MSILQKHSERKVPKQELGRHLEKKVHSSWDVARETSTSKKKKKKMK